MGNMCARKYTLYLRDTSMCDKKIGTIKKSFYNLIAHVHLAH